MPKLKNETDKEYQVRFKKEFIKHLNKMEEEDKKEKYVDRYGREYKRGVNSKYFVRKFKTGRYYSAYFLSDEVTPVIKA